jgi:hypothetical protein|tara:strand:- start:8210 stop:8626 length:417 start_codon:yes stop_codon:yes gene_type:complete
MASEIIVTIVTGFMFLLFMIWIGWSIYFALGKFGLWKFATYRRLKKKYRNTEFKDDAIVWAVDKIQKKWKFKDVRRFTKYETDGSELLYTFMSLSKLSPTELENINEKEVEENGGQTINRPEEEIGRTLPEIPRESSE